MIAHGQHGLSASGTQPHLDRRLRRRVYPDVAQQVRKQLLRAVRDPGDLDPGLHVHPRRPVRLDRSAWWPPKRLGRVVPNVDVEGASRHAVDIPAPRDAELAGMSISYQRE